MPNLGPTVCSCSTADSRNEIKMEVRQRPMALTCLDFDASDLCSSTTLSKSKASSVQQPALDGCFFGTCHSSMLEPQLAVCYCQTLKPIQSSPTWSGHIGRPPYPFTSTYVSTLNICSDSAITDAQWRRDQAWLDVATHTHAIFMDVGNARVGKRPVNLTRGLKDTPSCFFC